MALLIPRACSRLAGLESFGTFDFHSPGNGIGHRRSNRQHLDSENQKARDAYLASKIPQLEATKAANSDGFGYSQLQLACNLRHILTIARILSLLKILQSCDLQSGDPRAKGVVAAAGDDRKVRLDPKLYEQLRNRVLRQDGWKCQSCGTMSNREVHSNEFRSRPVTIQRRPDYAVRSMSRGRA